MIHNPISRLRVSPAVSRVHAAHYRATRNWSINGYNGGRGREGRGEDRRGEEKKEIYTRVSYIYTYIRVYIYIYTV